MAANVFRIFKPDGAKEDRAEKRRAQLRQAQQTYRGRKDQYTKSLEAAVASNKRTEAILRREAQDLRNVVQTLLSFVQQQGIELPSEMRRKAMIGLQSSESIAASYPSPSARSGNEELASPLKSPTETNEASLGAWRRTESSPSTFVIDAPLSTPNVRLSDLDSVVVGMEFVLTIERPCLGHLHGDPGKPEEPGGHALTASSQLLALSPPPSREPHIEIARLQQDAPKDILASLLRLAPELRSEHEVTPVQAWCYIRQQPYFGGVEIKTLQILAQALRDAVKCHGFGAVVTQDVFQKLLADVLCLDRLF